MKKTFLLFTLLLMAGLVFGQTYLINEGFESTTFPPTGWTNSPSGTVRSTNNPRTGSACLGFNGANDAIYTPQLSNPDELSFWYRRSSNTTAWTLKVQVSTDASNWTDIGSISDAGTNYQQFTHDLSSYSDIYVRMLDQRSTGAQERYVDDFTVTARTSSPSISVAPTSLTDFTYVVGSGPSTTQTFTVSGSNLTSNISLTAPTNYEISLTSGSGYTSPLTLNQSGGTVAATTIYARLKAGLAVGNYNNENITASSTGADNKTVTCSGFVTSPPPPDAPLATAATNLANNGFTANWNSVSGSTGYYLDVYTKQGDGTTDLFISEYIEGSSNNKVIEIYNGTGSSVDLSQYLLQKQTNGAGSFGGNFALTGTLANNAVHVVAHSSANATILGLAQQTTGGTPMDFNGNDAVALYKGSTMIDVVGVVDQVAVWGENMTLVRQADATAPSTTYIASEWDSYASDTITYLGSHTFSGGSSIAHVSGYENLNVNNVTSYNVTGLTPGTTYYYVVRAYNSYGTSDDSNEIEVTTTSTSPLITLSTASLSGFSYVEGEGPSAEQSFTVSGNNLIADISISAPTNYEIALVSGGPFSSSIELTDNNGVVEDTDIYVRLKAGLAVGTYNGEIIEISSDDADSKTVTCNGEVIAPPPAEKDLIHYWNFNDDTPADDSTNWDDPIDATIGSGYLEYEFSEAYSFGGTTINGIGDEENGGSFSPRGGPNNENNGECFDLIAPTTGYNNIVMTYPTRRTSTGFSTQTIYYTANGVDWIFKETLDISSYENNWKASQLITVDFSGIPEASNNALFAIRIYLDGATSASGNNRFDNIRIMGERTNPVELSSFTATISAHNYITLTWVTQTETGMRGYYVYRAPINDLANAQIVSPMIESVNSSQQQTYMYQDTELYDSGIYYYWLQANDLDGSSAFHGPVSVVYSATGDNPTPEIPLVTQLHSAYPNPFNPTVFIPFSLAEDGAVSFKIYNSRGQMVKHFDLGAKTAGHHRITWDGTDYDGKALANGVYQIMMSTKNQTYQSKATLLK